MLLALRFHASGSFQDICAELIGVDQSTASRTMQWVTVVTSRVAFTRRVTKPFLCIRAQFFISAATEAEPFLELYQSDKPLLPFLAQNLDSLIKNLMTRTVKEEVLEKTTFRKHQVGLLSSAERESNTTGVCCRSAAGRCVPPFGLFKKKRMPAELRDGAPPGSMVTGNDSGWTGRNSVTE